MTASWSATWRPRLRDREQQAELAAELAQADADLETAHQLADAAPACTWCRARARVVEGRVTRRHSYVCPLRRLTEPATP